MRSPNKGMNTFTETHPKNLIAIVLAISTRTETERPKRFT